MKTALTTDFKQQYATHLKRLRLQGLQPKTMEAYAHAIRHVAAYFDECIDDLSEAQLTDYFSDLIASHSWSTVRHRLYGLKFSHPCAAQAVSGTEPGQAAHGAALAQRGDGG